MKQIQDMLLAGQADEARARLAKLLQQQPDKLEPAADALTQMLGDLYTRFLLRPVHAFLDGMELELPAAAVQRLQTALGPRIALTRDWGTRLRGVMFERLARDCRKHIVTSEPKLAAEAGLKLLARAGEGRESTEAAALLARGLADLVQDRERTQQTLSLMLKNGGAHEASIRQVFDQYRRLVEQGGPRSFAEGDQAWQRQLTEQILSLREHLPRPNETGEPTPEQTEHLFETLHAILRGAMASGDAEPFIDALTIILDLCPVDAQGFTQVAGVEGRLFVQLGPRAKLTAVRALMRLGEIDTLRRSILALAGSPEGRGRTKLLCAIMGGLGHVDFLPWISRAVTHPEGDLEEAWAIDALGRLAAAPGAELLLKRLAETVKKIGASGNERRARALLIALGRIARVGRSRNLVTAEQRSQIMRKVIELVAPLERAMQFKAVEELFTSRLEEVDAKLKVYAATLCVDVMWGQPLRLPDATTGATSNGWREPMVGVLKRLGKDALPIILEAGAKHSTQYSGAMGALGNALEAIGDARACDLLETMLRTAFLQSDDGPQNKMLQEKVYDAATQQLKDLDRDELIHGLLVAMQHIGGDEALQTIMDYTDQVQAGRLASPGDLTMRILVDTKLKHGKLGEVTRRVAAPAIDDKAYRTALADARGGLLSRREKRIGGLALLGQARRNDALHVLLECLADKDAMIASAAQTALGHYMHPLPTPEDFGSFWSTVFGRESLIAKDRVLEPLVSFIRREVPKNAPYSQIFAREVETSLEDGALVHKLRAAAQPPLAQKPAEPLGSPLNAEMPADAEGAAPRPGRELTELDKKRAYLQARQEWIRGGKAGDPPSPPA